MQYCEQNMKIQNFTPYQNQSDDQTLDLQQLLKAKSNFYDFINSLGESASIPLSPANLRFSKEILDGTFNSQEIQVLIQKRVQRMMKNHKIKKNWGKEDCTILAWLLQKLTKGRHLKSPQKVKVIQWEKVASMIPGVTTEQCMFKWLSMKKVKLSNNKWSQNQSKMLEKVVKQCGTEDWKQISRFLFINNKNENKKYRSPKQCREQWNCYINPVVKKGAWTVDEDFKLLKEVQGQGRKWSQICRTKLVGRTENALKNRYNFLIQNKKILNPTQTQQKILQSYLEQLQQNVLQFSTQNRPQNDDKFYHKISQPIPQPNQNNPIQIQIIDQQPQKVTVIECNYDQIIQYLKRNSSFIPARIENNHLFSFNGQTQKIISVEFQNQCHSQN